MTLIRSISGIRGTIGGKPGEGLTPPDILKYAGAYATFIKNRHPGRKIKVVVGRDARISGEMVNRLVTGTLLALGVDVVDTGLSTTPTVEMAVTMVNADGGMILTASHNPAEWNALKLLNEKGEFLSAEDGAEILKYAEENISDFAGISELGVLEEDQSFIQKHIDRILQLDLVDVAAIREAGFRVAVDSVNSTGALAIVPLLGRLGVDEVISIYGEPTGVFPHNPEPLPDNVTEICTVVKKRKADVGFVVDPDVDRLAIITGEGEMFGEEYTLVAVADYVLQSAPGPTVSNLSSTQALRDVTEKYGMKYYASAVGEVNVVEKMKEVKAVIGGEGNGGVIYPELHYGRDALVGIALFLSYLARSGKSATELKRGYPSYHISKNKIELGPGTDVEKVLAAMAGKYPSNETDTTDGVKIYFPEGWVHMRKSNTEPIIRIYAEGSDKAAADDLAARTMAEISKIEC